VKFDRIRRTEDCQTMKATLRISILVAAVSLAFVSAAHTQGLTTAASSAAAKAVSTPSGGRPSTIQVRQNILAQKAAALQRELKELQRCIRNASQLQTLRDPEGNINIVPQNDIVNCTRRLQDLQRRQDSLNREIAALAQSAQPVAAAAERGARKASLQSKLQALSGSLQAVPTIRK
jgi:TolA-binding protein